VSKFTQYIEYLSSPYFLVRVRVNVKLIGNGEDEALEPAMTTITQNYKCQYFTNVSNKRPLTISQESFFSNVRKPIIFFGFQRGSSAVLNVTVFENRIFRG